MSAAPGAEQPAAPGAEQPTASTGHFDFLVTVLDLTSEARPAWATAASAGAPPTHRRRPMGPGKRGGGARFRNVDVAVQDVAVQDLTPFALL